VCSNENYSAEGEGDKHQVLLCGLGRAKSVLEGASSHVEEAGGGGGGIKLHGRGHETGVTGLNECCEPGRPFRISGSFEGDRRGKV